MAPKDVKKIPDKLTDSEKKKIKCVAREWRSATSCGACGAVQNAAVAPLWLLAVR
jgi:hypothetical protein